MTEKRFTTVYDEKSKMMQYVDTQKEEPNWWEIWNANKTLQIMNELADEKKQLKEEKDYYKRELQKELYVERLLMREKRTTEKRFENRLNKSNIKFNTLNPVWDNEKEDALNVFEMIELLNALHEENELLKKEILWWKYRCG